MSYIDNWNAFLASLATRGAAIFLLLLINAVGIGVTIWLIVHGYFVTALAATISTVLGNYNGALLMALKTSSEPIPAQPKVSDPGPSVVTVVAQPGKTADEAKAPAAEK